jgi:hypothetical protein
MIVRRPRSGVLWALIYAALLVIVGIFDDRLNAPEDPAAHRRVWAFVALFALAATAAVADVTLGRRDES